MSSITGDLKQFPIVDIIQLLNSTRNSGVLRVSGKKGESQLVFHNGDLVGANFLNDRVRIGQVLVSAGAITDGQLTQAMEIQKQAGAGRKPLVLTLLENSMIDEAAACSGIESLIVMTIVDILTWENGCFTLEMSTSEAEGGYQFPLTRFQQQILLNAQGILMESLRIYDEKVRTGTMDEILSIAGVDHLETDTFDVLTEPTEQERGRDSATGISTSLQKFAEQRKKIQASERDMSFCSPETIKRLVTDEFPKASLELKKQVAGFLAGVPAKAAETVSSATSYLQLAVIVITGSQLLSTMVKAVCRNEGIYAVSSEDRRTVDISVRLLLCQELHPVIMIDVPHVEDISEYIQLYRDCLEYRHVSVVMITCPAQWWRLGLGVAAAGVRAVLPRPCKECSQDNYAAKSLDFCNGLGGLIRSLDPVKSGGTEHQFFACISRLSQCMTLHDLALSVLDFMTGMFERAVFFNREEGELAAQLSFGVLSEKADGVAEGPQLMIPTDDQPVITESLQTGRLYYGFHSDSSSPHNLYREIGIPENPEIMLFPFMLASRVVAIVYADFGANPVSMAPIDYFDALRQYVAAQLEICACRQRLQSKGQ